MPFNPALEIPIKKTAVAAMVQAAIEISDREKSNMGKYWSYTKVAQKSYL